MKFSYSMPPEELVLNNTSLKFVESGVKWWLTDPRWKQAASEITACILNPGSIDPDKILKHSERRLVFQYFAADTGHTFVVKAFPLSLLRHRLKHQKYAYSEAKHLLIAKNKGLQVPEVYGYGLRKKLGLVLFNVVLMQYVDHFSLIDFLRLKNANECMEILKQRVSPLFIKMYHAGVNHIDCDPSAIFLSKNDALEDMLIDFQYVSFYQGKSVQTLAAQLGYFTWSVRGQYKFLSRKDLRQWFEYTINSAGHECNDLLWEIYEENSYKLRSIKQRLAGYELDL